jgi:hypothetical protein
MLAVQAAMEAVRDAAHDIARGLRVEIFDAETVEELEAIEWPEP